MGKKITSIQINNFKGYFRKYEPIELANGENLLIYGENGSGKTSFYKALNNFFISSRNNNISFVKNKYLPNDPCGIDLTFSDYDEINSSIIPNTTTSFSFSDLHSTHYDPLIQNTALTVGFLDYTDLLKVYLHDDPEPNLFDLIVSHLLGNHIPHGTGGNFQIGDRLRLLEEDLINNSYTRNDKIHRSALDFLPLFSTHLIGTLDAIFIILNDFLSNYFDNLNIQLNYNLAPIEFDYGNGYKYDWRIRKSLKLKVIKDGIPIPNGYNDSLNEARLSAIAICLYLASLKTNPHSMSLKILFLDDVFIGLDAGNRLPILEIIKNEFSDYQVFISTYDRHWFELSRKYFYHSSNWKSIEMYVGFDIDPNTGNSINKPLIVKGETYYEKAIRYLNHRSAPDYPASANYFRKALEELIKDEVPTWEKVDTENTQFPDFQLTKLISCTRRFLYNSYYSTTHIDRIYSLLSALLHPLSHHEITSPLYKGELSLIATSFVELSLQLKQLDWKQNFQSCIDHNKRLKITFVISPTEEYTYEILLKTPLAINRALVISKVHCVADITYGNQNGNAIPRKQLNKKLPNFNYESLEDAFNKIYTFINNEKPFVKPVNYLDSIMICEVGQWIPLRNKLIWK